MKTETAVVVEGRVQVESLDGEVYGGDSFDEVVELMRAASWGGAQADGAQGYMKQVAKRVWDWSRKEIRITTAEVFIRDMDREGLLKVREQ